MLMCNYLEKSSHIPSGGSKVHTGYGTCDDFAGSSNGKHTWTVLCLFVCMCVCACVCLCLSSSSNGKHA